MLALRWAICSFEPLRDCYHAQCDGAPAKVVQRVQASKEKKKERKKGETIGETICHEMA